MEEWNIVEEKRTQGSVIPRRRGMKYPVFTLRMY
jgi:hypothetical protein